MLNTLSVSHLVVSIAKKCNGLSPSRFVGLLPLPRILGDTQVRRGEGGRVTGTTPLHPHDGRRREHNGLVITKPSQGPQCGFA